MRILFANDGIGDAGGVQTYLAAVMPEIARRGHQVALLHLDPARGGEGSPAPAGAPHFCMQEMGVGPALEAARAWGPDVAFSHNMRPLEVERGLMEIVPTVKMMHGYFGTCIGGQKAHLWPRPEPCGRRFGPACLALYVPRRNGKMSLPYIADQYRWASEQNALFPGYAFVVTASHHMRAEYIRNGVHPRRARSIPLFSNVRLKKGDEPPPPDDFRVLFLGRMTRLKGGDYLIRAAAKAQARVGRSIPLTLAGDGPQRAEWEALAADLGVDATFPGWVSEEERSSLFRAASLLAVPSVWPEPFGLVGLEAGTFGVPAIAYKVGGIAEWLGEGANGWLAPGDPPTVEGLAALLVRAAANPAELAALRPLARAAARHHSLGAHLFHLERILDAAARRDPLPFDPDYDDGDEEDYR
jgi:glycosyltransferase involved in cell wall biosynthesis